MLWTHNRKKLTWHDSYVAPGCSGAGVPAVTAQSGIQFYDLYPEAQAVRLFYSSQNPR